MISFMPEQDMFLDDVEALVCPVNLNGVMGAGLAKYFAMRNPGCHMSYCMAIKSGQLQKGTATIHPFSANQKVIMLPTKINWWEDSTLELISLSLIALAALIQQSGIKSVGIPMIGCGCGNLSWSAVKELIVANLSYLSADIHVYGN